MPDNETQPLSVSSSNSPGPSQNAVDQDEELGRILNEFIDRKARGESVSEQELIAKHPQFAKVLQSHLAILGGLSATAAQAEPPSSAGMIAVPGYRVVRAVGRGGMGVVYEAYDLELQRVVAIKTLGDAEDCTSRRAFLEREAQSVARLRHPHIVAVHAYLSRVQPPCLVMDYIDGRPLHEAARNLSFSRKAELVEKVARAVDYAHGMGVVHRDLKPANILVDRDGEPHVLDFGLARAIDPTVAGTTLGGPIKGTPNYMAPEQIRSPETVGPHTDVFALGLILYELLTGLPPRQSTSARMLEEAADDSAFDIPLPRDVDSAIPEPLQRICLKACDPLPDQRYQSARHMADDLRRFVEGQPIRTAPRRYARLLEDRIHGQLDELAHWQQENLISRREFDSMADRLLSLLRTDSVWMPDARRIRLSPSLILLGACLIILSAIIWPVFYWNKLTSIQRILSVGIPTLMVNSVAVLLWFKNQRLVALILTITGILLTPAFWAILFGERHWFAWVMAESLELLPEPDKYFCNWQLSVSASLGGLYGGIWLLRKRFTSMAITFCVLLATWYAAFLLLAGLTPWLREEAWATIAVNALPFPLAMYLAARLLDRPRTEHLAIPFYASATVLFVLALSAIAYDSPARWFHIRPSESSTTPDWRIITQCSLFFVSGLVFLALAVVHDSAATRLRRIWGRLLFKLVPPFCLVSLDVMGDQPLGIIASIGGHDLSAAEAGVAVLCILLIIVGVGLQLRWYIYYALIHLSTLIVRATIRYFEDNTAWPLGLVIAGTVAVAVGIGCEAVMTRRSDPSRRRPVDPANSCGRAHVGGP